MLLAGFSASAATGGKAARAPPTRTSVVHQHCRAADASEGMLAQQLWLRVSHGGSGETGKRVGDTRSGRRPLWLDILLILTALRAQLDFKLH